ncbi:MAG: hypothetical protein DYG99_01225 [Bacteroidetes bacterium CHB5]|nr:hypothetical protein [Bacteroidetes bacterium CHB5]
MNCEESEKLLMRFGQLTNREEEELRAHTAGCPACAKAFEFIELEQHWIKKVVPAEPLHAAALTHKIMQALPVQKPGFSFSFLNAFRVGFAAGTLVLLFWLGSELLVEKNFHKPASAAGPLLNSAAYIMHPLERKTKTISLTERIKQKGL